MNLFIFLSTLRSFFCFTKNKYADLLFHQNSLSLTIIIFGCSFADSQYFNKKLKQRKLATWEFFAGLKSWITFSRTDISSNEACINDQLSVIWGMASECFRAKLGASNRYWKDGGASLSICQLWRQIQPKYGAHSMDASDGALLSRSLSSLWRNHRTWFLENFSKLRCPYFKVVNIKLPLE